MCGIFAAISTKKLFEPEQLEQFKLATDLVYYRGPDSSGYMQFANGEPVENKPFEIFLGHRRLSIIELSEAGSQPMHYRGLYIIFNGEIFNFRILRQSLELKGAIFQGNTDTEVILQTYLIYGEEGFNSFNGMWAFVLYDSLKNKIIISRDRFSIKPLYYLNQDDKFYFASEIKQLLPFINDKVINKSLMNSFISQALFDYNDETFFQNIKKIPARHNLIIELNENSTEYKPYWDFERKEILNHNNLTETFNDLLSDSIRLRLISDLKTGSLLSGGLDSSAITLIANHEMQGDFDSFSVISNDKKYSEEKFIDILVKKGGLHNTKLLLEPQKIINQLEKVIYHQDEPFAGFSMVAQYQIFEKIKKETDITVVLSGQGGDEILMGYLKYYFFHIKNLLQNKKYLKTIETVISSIIQRTAITQFNLAHARRYTPKSSRHEHDYLLGTIEKLNTWQSNDLRERQIQDIEMFSVPALAHYEDRNSMAWSIESRLPFLDHRLVNFMLNVGTDMKIRKGWNKYLLRESVQELPNEIRWRRDKKGFTLPEEVWIKNELVPVVKNTFKYSILHEHGIINKNEFLKAYESFLAGKSTRHYSEFIRVFIAEKWASNHFSA